jgi:hypothetical protein
MGGIYKVCHYNGLRWHDKYINFNIEVTTSTISEAAVLILLMGGTYEVCQ